MRERRRWISVSVADTALALCWIPFAVGGHLVESDPAALRTLVAAVMFLSFAHQPLTLPLVYASPWRLATHRRLFLWTPAVALLAVAVLAHVSLLLVAVFGALWNAEHTMMQRYGIARIYGRRAGDDQGRIEKWMFLGWLAVPVLAAAARGSLPGIVHRFGTGTVDATALDLLGRMSVEARAVLPLVAAGTAYLTGRWLRAERRAGSRASAAKRLYIGSTAALLAGALVDPLAAVVGFVGSHAVEYFVVVHRSVGAEAAHRGPLAGLVRMPHGRLLFFAAYAAGVSGLFVLLYRVASPSVLVLGVLTIGALHFFYDAFIWKLRRPDVAASLQRTPSPLAAPVAG